MENEETLAKRIEELNQKLDEIIDEQKNIKKQISKNNNVIMKRINKLQEYNEIDDMRTIRLDEHINKIAKVILEIEKRLY